MIPATEYQEEEIPLWRVAIDITIICLCLPIMYLLLINVTPHKRGYFSDDESLSYPKKNSTVTQRECLMVAFTVPVLTIMAMEMWISRGGDNSSYVRVGAWTLPHWVVRCIRYILLYTYGMESTMIFAHIGKITVGRLRPNFFDACQPNVTCRDTTAKKCSYIEDWKCVEDGVNPTTEVSISFPSGHAAISFYAAVFLVMYLEQRIWWPEQVMVIKTAFEILVMTMAWFTALSRIANHKHHWGDVVAGSLLGAAFAWFWIHHVLRIHAGGEGRRNYSTISGST